MKLGPLQRKILILLVGGLSIGLAYNPRKQLKIIKQISKELGKVDKFSLERAIGGLYKNKMVDFKENADGTVKLILSNEGKKKTLMYKIDSMSIKTPKRWDNKWRLIIFDIPEQLKKVREAMRFHLRRLGFYQLQKSAFVHPYECGDEIEFIIELYAARPFVRQIKADDVDNELHLKKIFKLI